MRNIRENIHIYLADEVSHVIVDCYKKVSDENLRFHTRASIESAIFPRLRDIIDETNFRL